MIFGSNQVSLSVVLRFSLIYSVVNVSVGFIIGYFVGVPSLADDSLIYWAFILYVPSCLLSIAVFFYLARCSPRWPYVHAVFVFIITGVAGVLGVSIIMGQLYIASTWFIDVPVSLFSLVVGVELGSADHLNKIDRVRNG